MKTGTLAVIIALWAPVLSGQTPPRVAVGPSPPPLSALLEVEEDQNDPAFAAYRKGYQLILDERWGEARKEFAAMLAKHPKSEYADDAGYWSAYALMHQDQDKARLAYQLFMEKNPHSTYYDDAVADLSRIQAGDTATAPPAPYGLAYSFGVGPRARDLEREFRRANREVRRLRLGHGGSLLLQTPGKTDQDLDPETRLKIDALYALSEKREDEQVFQTLKTIALDAEQPLPLREAAIDGLAGITRHDVLPVLVEVARRDTHPDLQAFAISVISQDRDRNKSVTLLIDLFGKLPGDRRETAETVFYTIAEVGNDRAIDFLKNVALTHKDYDLRRDAVYYLGNIGGERARAALYEILKGR